MVIPETGSTELNSFYRADKRGFDAARAGADDGPAVGLGGRVARWTAAPRSGWGGVARGRGLNTGTEVFAASLPYGRGSVSCAQTLLTRCLVRCPAFNR